MNYQLTRVRLVLCLVFPFASVNRKLRKVWVMARMLHGFLKLLQDILAYSSRLETRIKEFKDIVRKE